MNAPDEAYEYLAKNNLVESIIKYALNWKGSRTALYLKPWLEEQVTNAINDIELTESTKVATGSHYQTDNYDMILQKILIYCRNRGGFLTYVSDQTNWKVGEYWQEYWQTLEKRQGDCEDGAILMYCMARNAGVPANRLLLFAGDVEGGGHCWLMYRPQKTPILLRTIDWCYWTDLSSMYKKIPTSIVGNDINGDSRYKKMWWCFNEDGTYLKFKPTFTK